MLTLNHYSQNYLFFTGHQLNDYQIGCFVYRCMNNIIPSQLCDMFTMNATIYLHNTRRSNKHGQTLWCFIVELVD